MLAVKLLGIVDIITAIIILANIKLAFLTFPLFIVLLAKGVPSLGADIVGKIYGVVDIISAIVVLFAINLPVIGIVLALILLFKGATSLL